MRVFETLLTVMKSVDRPASGHPSIYNFLSCHRLTDAVLCMLSRIVTYLCFVLPAQGTSECMYYMHVLHTYIRMTGRRSSSSNDCQQQKQQKRQMQQGGAAETFMFDATRRIFQLRPSRQGGGVSDTIPSPKRHPNSYIKPNTGDGRDPSPPSAI